ncbi:MAG TPA: DUF1549 domain-containing protein, partial [Bryobacteraceae bacterium]|nr:DUF1549 domain-containing protein [Bryobacteraceae bacterium]
MFPTMRLLGLALLAGALSAQAPSEPSNQALFDGRMLPLLKKNCAACHVAANSSGGLSVSSLDSLLAGGKHGAALVPGDSRQSLLMRHIRGEQSPKMPMGGSLAADVITELAASIDAMKPLPRSVKKRDPHLDWLLRKPQSPAIPMVRDAAWARNPIDAFILARLEAKGLKPAPPASRRALLRRVYFDLIGLPPTPDEVQTFESDSAADAYAKVIDTLLTDSRYGERWARHWLDLARFAESDGFAIDGERPTAWRYRDYVIRSLNQDKPYDTFIKEQIAGDELPGNPSDRVLALGFLRMGTWEADANFKTQLRQDVLNELT